MGESPGFKALPTHLVNFAAWLSLSHQYGGADLPAGRFAAGDAETTLTAAITKRSEGKTWQGATHL